jgi:predicted heme/steroid binding protein
MSLGSCFAENIGKKMKDVYFETDINPFGVLYNPVSIVNSIEILLQDSSFTGNDIFENKSLWQSFSHSSLFSGISSEVCLDKINTRLNTSREFFKSTDFLLITFGTAWIFEDKKSGRVVSNCHKLPASEFVRRRLSVEEIVLDYSKLISNLQTLFPNLKLIFSVSPIRHWKDGAHENNISKSILLQAIDELQQKFDSVHYFPAYEIQLDELRDYRFYASDMIHPSDLAIEYIWMRFSDTYFSEQTLSLKKRLEQLSADLTHRPLHPESAEFSDFMKQVDKRKTELLTEFPFLSGRF